jgi:hypothetical protein
MHKPFACLAVWVDVGNKLIGVQVMQKWLGAGLGETLHVGDQFLGTGASLQNRPSVQCGQSSACDLCSLGHQ